MTGYELILPFLRPIEHLILDPDIREIMLNGPECVFIEKNGFLKPAPDVKLTEKSLMIAVKNILISGGRIYGRDGNGTEKNRRRGKRQQVCWSFYGDAVHTTVL